MVKVNPEIALQYTKFCVILMFTWPPWPEAGKFETNLYNILSWISISFPFLLLIVLCNAARYQTDDYLMFTKTICLAVSCAQVVAKMLICKKQRPRFEILHCHVRDFLKNATDREREMLQRYVNRCSPVHFTFNICTIAAALAMICGPLVLPQSLPTDGKYPFSVENHPARDVAYLHQAIAGLQCAGMGSIDCHMAFLIWFAGARLELLANDFQNVTNHRDFKICIRKHKILLENMKEMVLAVRLVIVSTSITTTLSIITGGIHIVSQEPLIMKSQFLILDFALAYILFITAWPAENLIDMCNAVGQGAYNSPWTQSSHQFRRNLLCVLHRSQRPVTISVPTIIPELSLSYYATFLSKAFSFFTTLRIIIGNVEEGS